MTALSPVSMMLEAERVVSLIQRWKEGRLDRRVLKVLRRNAQGKPYTCRDLSAQLNVESSGIVLSLCRLLARQQVCFLGTQSPLDPFSCWTAAQ